MKIRGPQLGIRVLVVLIVCAMVLPTAAMAATVSPVQPCASDYLQMYSTYMWAAGDGVVQVWFDVIATQRMDEVGVLSVALQESTDQVTWSTVKLFQYTEYEMMLIYNEIFHVDCVEYDGVVGRYYRAYVMFWAGKNGDGDSRRLLTDTVQAT